MIFDLRNEGGAEAYRTFESDHLPRVSDIIVKREHDNEWGTALSVTKVVHREGQRPTLHVVWLCGEQQL